MQDGKDLTDEFEEQALEQARDYGEQLAPSHACKMCTRLDLQPWQDERLKEIAGWQIDEDYKPFFRQPPQAPSEDHQWFYQEKVLPAFREAFHEHAADPENCDVCRDPELECGHERHEPDGCPVGE